MTIEEQTAALLKSGKALKKLTRYAVREGRRRDAKLLADLMMVYGSKPSKIKAAD